MIEPIRIPIAELIPDPENANLGTERGREALATALRERRAGRSILLDKHGRIIAGNKSAAAAAANGIAEVLVIPTDGRQLIAHQRTDLDLDEPEGRLAAFEDNRTAELDLSWDLSAIQSSIAEGVDLSHLWDDDELDAIMRGLAAPKAPDEFAEYDEGIETEYCCPRCQYRWSGKPSAG